MHRSPQDAVFDPAPAVVKAEPATARRLLATELNRAILRAEKRLGRSVSRPELSKLLNVSVASLYAYLNGTTLPRGPVFDRLLDICGITGAEAGRLSTLRDAVEAAQRVRRGAGDERQELIALPPPRQLPAPVSHFSGRDDELRRLNALIGAESRTVVVATIAGMAGVGKTALALQWCHRIKDRFPDGQLYANLHGFDRRSPVEAEEVLHTFLHALGVVPAAMPGGVNAKSALLRSLLAQRRVLMLIDNARSADQVRPLLPGSACCLTVVTSRDLLDGLAVREGAPRVVLDVPPRDEAIALLAARLGPQRPAAEPEAADELLRLCARLPLALGVMAARAAASPTTSLHRLAAQLRDTQERLDRLSLAEPDLDLRSVFHWSYGALSAKAARLFRLLGLHPGPEADGYACAALLGTARPPTALLTTLVSAHLITEQSPGRYELHDLLRLYAVELAGQADTQERRDASERVLDYYLHTAASANRLIQPAAAKTDRTSQTGTQLTTPPLCDYAQAMEWFDTELPTLLSAVEWAAESGFASHSWQIAAQCTVFLRRAGRRSERVRVHRIALGAAEISADRAAGTASMRMLADALAGQNRREEAAALLYKALAECQALGDRQGVRQTHLSFVRLYHAQNRYETALGHARQALRLAQADGDPLAVADGLTAVAKQYALLGWHDESRRLGTRALALYSQLAHLEGEADILLSLGRVEHESGRYPQAIRYYERSRDLDRQLGDRFWEAQALDRLADSHDALGRRSQAMDTRAHAVALLEALHHPDAERIRAKSDDKPR